MQFLQLEVDFDERSDVDDLRLVRTGGRAIVHRHASKAFRNSPSPRLGRLRPRPALERQAFRHQGQLAPPKPPDRRYPDIGPAELLAAATRKYALSQLRNIILQANEINAIEIEVIYPFCPLEDHVARNLVRNVDACAPLLPALMHAGCSLASHGNAVNAE